MFTGLIPPARLFALVQFLLRLIHLDGQAQDGFFILFGLGEEVLHFGEKFSQNSFRMNGHLFGIPDVGAMVVQMGGQLKAAGRNVGTAGLADTLSTLRLWVLLDSVLSKGALPLGRLLTIAHDLLG